MGNPYPIDIADADSGVVRLAGVATFTDPDNQPGGGSQTLRLLGAYTFTQADVPNDQDFFVLPYTPAAGDIILDIICRVVTAFDCGGGPVTFNVYDGATGSNYGGGAFDLTVSSASNPNTSANGAEPLADRLRVPLGTALTTPAFMGGTPPVAQEVRISYADNPVAVGEAALYFLVATPSL